MKGKDLSIVKKIIWLRLAQIIVNERYKNGDFVVPIHLALGHESIAVAIDSVMRENACEGQWHKPLLVLRRTVGGRKYICRNNRSRLLVTAGS